MLISIQFPLADVRSFMPGTGLLEKPFWPDPLEPDKEFVRGFGCVRSRRAGGISGWIGEQYICEAQNAIRFSDKLNLIDQQLPLRIPLHCVYRHFYSSGYGVNKYEMGLGDDAAYLQLQSEHIQALVTHFLDLNVHSYKVEEHHRLVEMGKPLAQLYLNATTDKTTLKTKTPPAWWVQSGLPIIFIKAHPSEIVAIPYKAHEVELSEDFGFKLFYARVAHRGREYPLWVLEASSDADRDKVRLLRMYLLRLHAEFECMKIIASHLRGGRLVIVPRSTASDNFQIYLRSSLERVNKVEKGFSKHFQISIAQTAHEALDLMTPGQREALLKLLRQLDIRLNLLNNARSTTKIFIKEYNVSGDTYSGNFSGAILNIRSKLENVTQTINNIPKATEEDKQKLQQLVTELKTELEKTTPERAEDAEVVADQLETLLDKANQENTSKKSLEITGEGLKKAAENILDVLPTVLTIATRIVTHVLGMGL